MSKIPLLGNHHSFKMMFSTLGLLRGIPLYFQVQVVSWYWWILTQVWLSSSEGWSWAFMCHFFSNLPGWRLGSCDFFPIKTKIVMDKKNMTNLNGDCLKWSMANSSMEYLPPSGNVWYKLSFASWPWSFCKTKTWSNTTYGCAEFNIPFSTTWAKLC